MTTAAEMGRLDTGRKWLDSPCTGELGPLLASPEPVTLRHRLESVKILPPVGANEPDLYGAITAQATSRPEIQEPSVGVFFDGRHGACRRRRG